MKYLSVRLLVAAALVTGLFAVPASANTYTVSVGYADGIRGGGFFPNPWLGDPNIVGTGCCVPFDAGAILIGNTSGGTITVNSIVVDVGANSFNLWGSNTLLAGQSLIATSTTNYNFDTSDFSSAGCGGNNGVIPTVTVTVDGTPTTFSDTGQVLNTSGYDFACQGNESFAWRPIGTFGGPAGAPEPSSLLLLGITVVGLGAATRLKWFAT
jgi:hypothetical protein